MATMLNFEVIFDKFKTYRIQSKLKITITILIGRRMEKLCNNKVDFIRSGRKSAC